jgi:ribonucleoside-diphosphate reductase alpha chain
MKKIDPEKVRESTLRYFGGDELATSVTLDKYLMKDHDGDFVEESPRDMHVRLAREFHRIESAYPNPMSKKDVMCLLSNVDEFVRSSVPGDVPLQFLAESSTGLGPVIPQGSPMSAIGNVFKLQSASNCFVIESPEDSFGGIFLADHEEAEIMKRRGGVGFDVSKIRPKGMPTMNAAGTTDGIEVFLSQWSDTCRRVAQGGRRGALMMTIDARHAEIETFINVKRDTKKVTGANMSIQIPDELMEKVDSDDLDASFELKWPVDAQGDDVKCRRVVKARQIFDKIIDAAWMCAEPGAQFSDTIRKMTPSEAYADVGFKFISSNPCSEIFLSAYDSCRLLLIDLTKFVKNPFTPHATFDYERFMDVARKAQRLMDDLVDLEIESIDRILAKIDNDKESEHTRFVERRLWEKIKVPAIAGRRTGLGVTALGDALAYLGIVYGSPESIEVTEKIYRSLAIAAYESSIDMAAERGAFPAFDHAKESNHPFIKRILEALSPEYREKYAKYGRRNIALTTTAPAGSVSCLTMTTSGIEPVFKLSYTRKKKVAGTVDPDVEVEIDALGDRWTRHEVFHHGLRKWMNVTGKTNPEESPYYGATANEIDWLGAVRLQAAAQKWICHGISKTVNLPKDVSREVVAQVYLEAWRSGCKGITVYRDGCRDGVLVDSQTPSKTVDMSQKLQENHAPKRPKSLPCDVYRINVRSTEGIQKYLVLVGLLDDKPYEVFCGMANLLDVPKSVSRGMISKRGRSGAKTYELEVVVEGEKDTIVYPDIVSLFDNPVHGALTRGMSLCLRHGIPVNFLVEQLLKDKSGDIHSFHRAIARVLKNYIPDGTKSHSDKTCPVCGAEGLVYLENCVRCLACGKYGKCLGEHDESLASADVTGER